MDEWGFLDNCRYLIHDRDAKYCQSFRNIIESGDVKTLPLPARSPNLNAFAERWVKSVKDECLSKLMANASATVAGDRCPVRRCAWRAARPSCARFVARALTRRQCIMIDLIRRLAIERRVGATLIVPVVIRKNTCGLRYQLYLSQHMHRCEQSHGVVGEGFKNLVVVVKTERFFVQNI